LREQDMTNRHSDFIPELGRPRLYDHLKQRVKKYSPAWFRRLAREASIPFATAARRRLQVEEVRKALPGEKGDEFLRLYDEARSRWDQGVTQPTGDPIRYPLRGAEYFLWLRPGTCDLITYYDVIIHELYGKAAPEGASTIIDCGANIGLASAYFLARYPDAQVIALEPDPINFALCSRNLEPFGDRVRLLPKALWADNCRMLLAGGHQGTWASQVQPDTGRASDAIEGVDMPTLLTEYGLDRVDILKMDIEGAEVDVLSSTDLCWLERIRTFQIESKLEKGRQLFVSRLSPYGFSFASYGEILIAQREKSDGVVFS
jgi:FkbM family methyltransferase